MTLKNNLNQTTQTESFIDEESTTGSSKYSHYKLVMLYPIVILCIVGIISVVLITVTSNKSEANDSESTAEIRNGGQTCVREPRTVWHQIIPFTPNEWSILSARQYYWNGDDVNQATELQICINRYESSPIWLQQYMNRFELNSIGQCVIYHHWQQQMCPRFCHRVSLNISVGAEDGFGGVVSHKSHVSYTQ